VARKSNSTIVQEELYPLPDQAREPFDDSRLVDLETEQESPFLRGQKRVSVRRGSLPRKTANRLKWVALTAFVLAIAGVAGATLYRYGKHSWRFRVDSSDLIEISGAQHVTHAQIMEVMGGDIGRNIFFIPLAQRKLQLEQIPWVESASVMRFVPNRLSVEIHERTPVAFARIGSRVSLIDAGGTLMELAPGGKHKYSFPVIAGMNAGEPLSTRAARMKSYNELVRQLDSGGARYSQELSEVDLNDIENVKVVAADSNGEVLVHLGSGNYLQRYRTYVTHVQQWRQQFDKLESVDLRYDGQIIVNPDLQGMSRQPVLTPAAAKAAMAAGVKPAAIVNYEKYVTHAAPPAALKKQAKPPAKAPVRATVHRAPSKPAKAKKPPVSIARNIAPVPHAGATTTVSGKTTKPVAPPSSSKTSKPAPPPPSLPAPAAGQKKPSAAIPRETAKDQR
jgi:cell division protein FtsQ